MAPHNVGARGRHAPNSCVADELTTVGPHIDRVVGPTVVVLKVFNAMHGLEPSVLATDWGGGAARSASPCSVPFGLASVKIVLRQMASLTMKQWQTSNFRMSWWQSSVNRLLGGGYIGKGQLHRMTYFGSQYRNMTSFFNFARSELFFFQNEASNIPYSVRRT
jgi:hypothetical protein